MNRSTRTRVEAGRLVQMKRRILETYESASPDVIAAGESWYPNAADIAATLHDDLVTSVGVIAALSPRCKWHENVRRARVLLEAAIRGDQEPPSVHTGRTVAQAWRIAHGEPALDVLQGQKVRSFYRNILGDVEAVTVDAWAALVATGAPNKNKPTRRAYDLISRAYREVAARVSTTPAACQATVWVAVRGSAA